MKLTRISSILLSFTLWAQEQQPLIRTTTSEVVVDVVIRDKKGKLVRGLSAADFTVTEDGQAQQMTAVREVAGLSSGAPSPVTPGSRADPGFF